MSVLKNKIDFALLVTVTNANPNGDPLNGNRPREDFAGYGEISDVCIKRKIRNRLQDFGEDIFVKMDERCTDGFTSLSERAKNCRELAEAQKKKDSVAYAQAACEKWIDVRSFGQVFAFKAGAKGEGVSVGVRGPVSIHPAMSVSPIVIEDIQITKSTSSESKSDTMGTKHRVKFGLYLIKGSITCQLAERTGFSEEDAEKIKEALRTLFENDASAARPEGSMEVVKMYWWKHNCASGQYSSAKVHRSLKVTEKENLDREARSVADYDIILETLEGLKPEVYEGI